MHRELIAELEREIDPDYAAAWAPFFGIKPGKYGEHDILLGIHVPTLRKIAAMKYVKKDTEITRWPMSKKQVTKKNPEQDAELNIYLDSWQIPCMESQSAVLVLREPGFKSG